MSQEELKKQPSYEEATGPIGFTLKSDLLFHVVMQQQPEALIGLICALKGIDRALVKDIRVENPIDISVAQKETVMDLKLILNTNEIINIELQMYFDKYWNNRSILYLCRAFDCLKDGEDYSKLKPTTHYCITDKELFENNTTFYSRYFLMEEKTHQIYTYNFSIGVVQLQYEDNATEEDKAHNLLFWSKLINAETWEEFKDLAKGNAVIEEVGNLMLQVNADDLKREALEAQRKYREQYASQYTAGYTDCEEKLNPIIDDLTDQNNDLKTEVTGLKTENTGLKTENTGLKTENTGLKTENTGLKTENTGLKTENTELKTENTGLKAEITDLKSALEKYKAEYGDIE